MNIFKAYYNQGSPIFALCSFLSAVIFIIDINIPLGVATGVLYIAVVLIALKSQNLMLSFGFASLGTILIVLGFFFSEFGGIYWMVLANRSLSIGGLWLTALLGFELKKLNFKLKRSEGRFQMVADKTRLMFWQADLSGGWHFFSQGWFELTGRNKHTEAGFGWMAGLHPNDRQKVEKDYYRAINELKTFEIECRILGADNQYRWLVLQGAPHCNEENEIDGFIGTGLDTTKRREAESKLEDTRQRYFHREKMASIGTLAAGILHEFGNPIASITGLVQEVEYEILNNDQGYNPLIVNYLEMVNGELARLTRISRDVNDFVTMPVDGMQMHDVNDLISRTCGLMRHDERMWAIKLETHLDKNLPATFLVADHLVQVLQNLIGNAIDALAEVTEVAKITISSQLNDSNIVICVADNGCGMTEEILSRACEAFFTTKKDVEGSGLGLSLCETLVAENNGILTISSQVDQGTRVNLLFPFTSDEGLAG